LVDLATFVFDVKPKHIQKGERYFEGKIWVDDREFQIVKAMGQAVPEVGNQRFPHFETHRAKFGGKHWFPIYTASDDVLKFRFGLQIHIKMTIRYHNYKRFRVEPIVCFTGDCTAEMMK